MGTQNQYGKTRKKEVAEEERQLKPVPRHIALKFMAIEGVKDVKTHINTEDNLEIILVVNKGGYNRTLHENIIRTEFEIKMALKARQQKFNASISW